MNENYTFTTAQTEDLPHILDIFEVSIRADYDVAEEVIRKCLANLAEAFNNRQNDFSFWVAKEVLSAKVVGWLSYLPIFDSILKKDTALEASIYLDAEYRANGLGFDFFDFTLPKIKLTKFNYVYGFIKEDNLFALNLVSRVGFISIGKIPPIENEFPYSYEKRIVLYKLK